MSSSSADLFKSTINEYLDNLPETVHSQLYKSPETCLAIFRLLPSLAKFYIMTLLFQETSIPYSDLNRWIKMPSGESSNYHTSSVHNFKNPNKIYQNDCIKRLKSLNLLKDLRKQVVHPTTGQPTMIPFVQLNPIFRQSFRDALTGSKKSESEPIEAISKEDIANEEDGSSTTEEKSDKLNSLFDDDDRESITIDFLDSYCLSKWENILHFMVGSEIKSLPSVGVLTLLRYSGLMELPNDRKKREDLMIDDYDMDYEGSDRNDFINKKINNDLLKTLLITKNGFQFLLQDINSQIWTLLLQYLKMSEKLMMNPVDVLNFIFMLGSLELGEGYPIEMLSDTQMIMLEDLIDYGLIYYPVESSKKFFYPTRLSTTLTSEHCNFKTASVAMEQEISNANNNKEAEVNSASALIAPAAATEATTTTASNQGSIIIETNFKIYCYTSSPLQIAILNLFVNLKARFTNMVTGILTRESIRNALMNGITSTQIINYLESHADPYMHKLAEDKLQKKIEYEQSVNPNNTNNNASSSANNNGISDLNLEILPPTVVDQVKLWQLELDRIQSFKGYLYKDFTNDLEFEKLLNYGEEIDIIIWKDRLRRKFFVNLEGNGQLIEYANRILRKGGTATPRSVTPSTPVP